LIARAASELGCRSVAFTYNDPVIFLEYAVDTAIACRERGLKSVAVTAGYINPEARTEFYRHMDAANVDLKGFTEEFYEKTCYARLGNVLDTLVYLKKETPVWLEVTTLLIPGLNDSDDELNRAADWYAANLGPDVPWHFTAFHPDWRMLDVPPTPHQTLLRARDIARSRGLRYVYVGNVHDDTASSTYCPCCSKKLIGRDWFELTAWNLDAKGACADCGTCIAGVFDDRPGTWGSRRRPVRLQDFSV
jgi:pyruvate formate lyase activating enzyme